MSYRDDRHALRERAETLERELDAARQEIELLRSGDRPSSAARPGRARGMVGSVLFGALLIALLIVAPLPVPMKLTLGVLVASSMMMALLIGTCLVVARPAEAAILFGGASADGGFRALVGGRALRVPFVEQLSYLELGVFRVPLSLRARDRDGKNVTVDLVLHAELGTDAASLERSVPRFVGCDATARAERVNKLLEPVVRHAIATLGAAELRDGSTPWSDRVESELRAELEPWGIRVVALFVFELGSEAG